MAKPPPKISNSAKVKLRVVEFEMDGSDESIQDTMKTLAAALTRGSHGFVPIQRRMKAEPPTTLSVAAQMESDTEEESVDEDERAVDDVVPKPVPHSKRPKKVQTYNILEEIRFDKSPVTLEEFVEQYNLKSDLKRYLAIALWFKEQLKVEQINVRHWYTAYKYLKWTIPNSPGQPIRDLRANNTLSKGTALGHTFINHIGEKDLQPLLKKVV